MYRRSRGVAALAAALALVPTAVAGAQGPPPPTATSGQPVETVGAGVGTPTSFAFDGANAFVGSAPAEGPVSSPGGVFLLKDGQAVRIEGTPEMVMGLAARKGVLYVSAGKQIIAFSGFDGTKFASQKTVYSAAATFPGFNGLAFGPDGRLYAGVSLDPRFDGKKNPHRYAETVLSLKPNGKGLKVVSRGLRQPFQLAFVGKERSPYVTELAVDKPPVPHDSIVVAKPGADFGYPTCKRGIGRTCKGFAKPAIALPAHASPMGIAAVGKTLYVALFGGIAKSGPEVVSIAAGGGTPKPVLAGFVAPVVALGVHDGALYAGDVTGTVYKTALR
jgi:glucose/arabinose dehydrogenase